MLPATPEEKQAIIDYMIGQAPDLKVEFLQKVYVENVLSHQHAVWDVHTNVDRWWVITNPTNLYSQEQFPNMDLAVTFHVGLCIRIPRGDRTKVIELEAEPFLACFRHVVEAMEALATAQEVTDYQAIGVRCREALLAFTSAAQTVMPWAGADEPKPKQADFKAWIDHICAAALSGQPHEHRRHLFKALLDEAWRFSNWLTHAKASTWYDAEAATSTVEHALGLITSLAIRNLRSVPEACPACGSILLSPQRGENTATPGVVWERPVCSKCGWTGTPVPILPEPDAYSTNEDRPPEGECVIPAVPLSNLRKPCKGERSEEKNVTTTMNKKKAASKQAKAGISLSQLIDARIAALSDWRGETLARVRNLIRQADAHVVEAVKWRKPSNPMGVPVWEHNGILCTGETYKDKVKLTFAKGAALEDPSGLFNASLDGNVRRAIDLHEGDKIDAKAFKALIRAAVALNTSRAVSSRKTRRAD